MDIEPLYCAEQISVPESLPDVLKRWTKAVIRENPVDIVAWSAECVLAGCREGGGVTGVLAREEGGRGGGAQRSVRCGHARARESAGFAPAHGAGRVAVYGERAVVGVYGRVQVVQARSRRAADCNGRRRWRWGCREQGGIDMCEE
jgi:hypothetical protein